MASLKSLLDLIPWPSKSRRAVTKGAALREIQQARQEIGDIALVAIDDEANRKILGHARSELEKLEEEAKLDTADFERIASRAKEVARFRAFIMTPEQLKAESQSILGELSSWQIPASALKNWEERLKANVVQADLAVPANLAQARLEIFEALDEYLYWDSYIDWYLNRITWASGVLFVVAVASLAVALLCFARQWMLIGFLVAGLCGTSVSLLASLPPVSVYGQMMGLWSRILYRYAVGMAGTAVGCGFLSLGLVELLPKQFNFVGVMDFAQQSSAALDEQSDESPHKKQPAEKKLAATDASEKKAVETKPVDDTAKSSAPTNLELDNAAAKTAVAPPVDSESELPASSQVAPSSIAILLALGILLGFTERALGSFEDQLFPSGAGTAKAGT